MSVRDHAIDYTERAGRGGRTAGGGSVVLAAGAHALDGPEHLAPADTTALNATTARHGLLPKLSGVATDGLHGDGTWSTDNPMTTQDDLLVGAAAGAPARLAKGSDGQVLTVDRATHHLVWAAPPAPAFSGVALGDMLYGGWSSTDIAPTATPTSNYANAGDYGSGPTGVNDGNEATLFRPAHTGSGVWVRLAFGAPVAIDGWRVKQASTPASRAFEVGWSDDGSTWTVAGTGSAAVADSGWVGITGAAHQYWRIVSTTSASDYWNIYTVALRSTSNPDSVTLPIGSAGNVLTVAAGVPVWATPAGSSPLTTKGDIHGFSTADARLPVGTDAQVLTADSTQALGVKWSAAGAGGGGVTVQDEGTPLATVADTLDFVGAGVVASGTGTTKTITISGASVSEITSIPTAETVTTKVLAPDGAGGVAFRAEAGGGGGALVLLEQHTASSSAALDITTAITSAYDDYLIELLNLLPATNSNQLAMKFSTDGGANWIGSGYAYQHLYAYGAGTNAWEGSASAANIMVSGGSVSNAGSGVSGSIRLYNPLAAGTDRKCAIMEIVRQHTSVGTVRDGMNTASLSVGPVNAVRLYFTAGNIASGVIRVYGLAK